MSHGLEMLKIQAVSSVPVARSNAVPFVSGKPRPGSLPKTTGFSYIHSNSLSRMHTLSFLAVVRQHILLTIHDKTQHLFAGEKPQGLVDIMEGGMSRLDSYDDIIDKRREGK